MTKEQKNKMKNAISLFKQGDFEPSKALFSEALLQSPSDASVLIYTGYLALLENRLKDAQDYLQKALVIMPKSKEAKSLLANVFYRMDDFDNAAAVENSAYLIEKYQNLAKHKAYEISSTVNKTEIKFIKKDPLPLIRISINGAEPVHFLIDTGGGELIIDTEYAKGLGLKEFGAEKATFGGGKKANYTHSIIDTLQLGDFQVKNVPVVFLDTRRFSAMLYGDEHRVDGILGTYLFARFLTTLDYVNEKIVFEIKNTATSWEDRLKTEAFSPVRFWMVDHFMLARGRVNNAMELLFLIDTGLAGMGFTCPKSTLKEGRFVLKKAQANSGLGGGGKIQSIPFDVESLSLGGIVERNIHGLYGPFPPAIEHSYGLRIGGLISHEFFRNHTVIFDYSKMTLYIK